MTSLFEGAEPAVAAGASGRARAAGPLEPVEIPLLEEIATITQLVLLPEAAGDHLGWLRTRFADSGRTSERGCSRGSSCRRAPT